MACQARSRAVGGVAALLVLLAMIAVAWAEASGPARAARRVSRPGRQAHRAAGDVALPRRAAGR
jgi:hypothetical protein